MCVILSHPFCVLFITNHPVCILISPISHFLSIFQALTSSGANPAQILECDIPTHSFSESVDFASYTDQFPSYLSTWHATYRHSFPQKQHISIENTKCQVTYRHNFLTATNMSCNMPTQLFYKITRFHEKYEITCDTST